MQTNMDFEKEVSKMAKYTNEILISELTRAKDMKVTELSYPGKNIKALPPLIGQVVGISKLMLP